MEYTKWSDLSCPKCGATLLDNGTHVWCSYVYCDYGIEELIEKDEFLAEQEPDLESNG
jgi:hypothetical protein